MTSLGRDLDISVVVLCYRAEELVPAFVARLKDALEKRGLAYEVVLVANYHAGSRRPDRTPEIVRDLARHDPTLTAVARPKEGMMGWDMRTGLALAQGARVVVIDGDGQMPAIDVVTVYDCLETGGFDMAMTFRQERHDGATRLFVSRVYNALLKLLFPSVSVRDANSKPKIFTRAALRQLHLTSDDWFIDAEIVIQASEVGFRIGEVPTTFFANPLRASFIGVGTLFEFFAHLVRYRLQHWWH